MNLEQFFDRYPLGPEKLAVRAGLSGSCIWHYLAGRRIPTQKSAEKLELATDGLVTVVELRGKDDRKKR